MLDTRTSDHSTMGVGPKNPRPARSASKVLAVGAAVAAVVALFGWWLLAPQEVHASADEVGLQYSPTDEYLGVVPAGDALEVGSRISRILSSDSFYFYPTSQQTFLVRDGDQTDAAPMVVVTMDGVRVEMSGQLYFALNAKGESVRAFHEQFGLANGAYADAAQWRALVASYIRPQLDRALDAVTLRYDWQQLRTDPELRGVFEQEVAAKTQDLLAQAMGGSYFCGAGSSSQCEPMTFGLDRVKPMNAELSTVSEEEARKAAERASVQAEIDQLGVDGYLTKLQNETLQKAIESGKVSIYVVPQGTDVPVPAAP
jgi:hypothetical protein